MPAVNPGEVWMTDFGMAAKVRPALVLTGNPAADELDLVTLLLHTPTNQREWAGDSTSSSIWILHSQDPHSAIVWPFRRSLSQRSQRPPPALTDSLTH